MILLLFTALLISCTEGDTLTETDTGNNVAEKPYTIKGTVKDGEGKCRKKCKNQDRKSKRKQYTLHHNYR